MWLSVRVLLGPCTQKQWQVLGEVSERLSVCICRCVSGTSMLLSSVQAHMQTIYRPQFFAQKGTNTCTWCHSAIQTWGRNLDPMKADVWGCTCFYLISKVDGSYACNKFNFECGCVPSQEKPSRKVAWKICWLQGYKVWSPRACQGSSYYTKKFFRNYDLVETCWNKVLWSVYLCCAWSHFALSSIVSPISPMHLFPSWSSQPRQHGFNMDNICHLSARKSCNKSA